MLLTHAEDITKKLKKLGYLYVTMDLNGYSMGSMNLSLSEDNICRNQ